MSSTESDYCILSRVGTQSVPQLPHSNYATTISSSVKTIHALRTHLPPLLQPAMHDHAALRVITDHSLFSSVVAFVSGLPFFALQVKQQLKCTQPPHADTRYSWRDLAPAQDVELWQNAVLTGDKRTLEALHLLAANESSIGEQVRAALKGIIGYALLHSRDTVLLDWIDANKMFGFNEDIDRSVDFELGKVGDLERIRWVHEHGRLIRPQLASGAATSGHLSVLQYLQTIGPTKTLIGEYAMLGAAENGHLHILEFLIEVGEWDHPRELVATACSKAVAHGHLHILRYLHENGYAFCDYDIDIGAANGHLDVVKYLHENRVGDNPHNLAVKNGYPEIIQYLCENGYTCRSYIID